MPIEEGVVRCPDQAEFPLCEAEQGAAARAGAIQLASREPPIVPQVNGKCYSRDSHARHLASPTPRAAT